MKSKFLPCLIMLLAGFVCSIVSIEQRADLMTFTTRLLAVFVIFYIIGAIIRVVFDKAFAAMSDKKDTPEEASEEAGQDTDSKESDEKETDPN